MEHINKSSYEEGVPLQEERIASRGSLLLSRFREVDDFTEYPPHNVEKANLDAAEDLHDHFMGIFAELPERDIDLARETYEALTDSDNPRDRYWAATFFSHMLPVDKNMGLSMLSRLISREETEHAVQDRAWDELCIGVADVDLLPASEIFEYVNRYFALQRERADARIRYARGKKIDDHTKYDRFPPYRSFPPPGDTTT